MTRIHTLELFDGVARAMNANPDPLAAFRDIVSCAFSHARRETERVRLAVTAGHCRAYSGRGRRQHGRVDLVDGDVRWWSELLASADPVGLVGLGASDTRRPRPGQNRLNGLYGAARASARYQGGGSPRGRPVPGVRRARTSSPIDLAARDRERVAPGAAGDSSSQRHCMVDCGRGSPSTVRRRRGQARSFRCRPAPAHCAPGRRGRARGRGRGRHHSPPGMPKAGYSKNAHDGDGFRTRLRARVLHLRAGNGVARDRAVRPARRFGGATASRRRRDRRAHRHPPRGAHDRRDAHARRTRLSSSATTSTTGSHRTAPASIPRGRSSSSTGSRRAIVAAYERRVPARVAMGTTEVLGLTRNRSLDPYVHNETVTDKREAPQRKFVSVNPELHVLRVDGIDGAPSRRRSSSRCTARASRTTPTSTTPTCGRTSWRRCATASVRTPGHRAPSKAPTPTWRRRSGPASPVISKRRASGAASVRTRPRCTSARRPQLTADVALGVRVSRGRSRRRSAHRRRSSCRAARRSAPRSLPARRRTSRR